MSALLPPLHDRVDYRVVHLEHNVGDVGAGVQGAAGKFWDSAVLESDDSALWEVIRTGKLTPHSHINRVLSFINNSDGSLIAGTAIFKVDLCAGGNSPDYSTDVDCCVLAQFRDLLDLDKLEWLGVDGTIVFFAGFQMNSLIKSEAEVIIDGSEALVGHFDVPVGEQV